MILSTPKNTLIFSNVEYLCSNSELCVHLCKKYSLSLKIRDKKKEYIQISINNITDEEIKNIIIITYKYNIPNYNLPYWIENIYIHHVNLTKKNNNQLNIENIKIPHNCNLNITYHDEDVFFTNLDNSTLSQLVKIQKLIEREE
jgi:hypothetical protein